MYRRPERPTDGTDDVSFNNANGYEMLQVLGLDGKPWGDVALEDFATRVATATASRLDRRSPALEPYEDLAPGKMTMIFPGRRAGYIESRLGDLAQLAQYARARGATRQFLAPAAMAAADRIHGATAARMDCRWTPTSKTSIEPFHAQTNSPRP